MYPTELCYLGCVVVVVVVAEEQAFGIRELSVLVMALELTYRLFIYVWKKSCASSRLGYSFLATEGYTFQGFFVIKNFIN